MDFISVDFEWKKGKRQQSREKLEKSLEKEKNFRKKENFFRRDFFSRENSLLHFLSTSNAFSTFLNYSNSSDTSNASIFMFDYSSSRIFREKYVKREVSLGRETFLWKWFSHEKSLFFLRLFSFSLSLCKFSFKMFLLKPSLKVCIASQYSLYW